MTLLFLNSLGTGEVLLILFVVLVLFGSKGIPDFAKNMGRGMREIRNASNEIRRDIQKSALEMRKDLNVENPLEDITKIPNQAKDMLDLNKKDEPVKEEPKDDNEQKDKTA